MHVLLLIYRGVGTGEWTSHGRLAAIQGSGPLPQLLLLLLLLDRTARLTSQRSLYTND